MFTIPKTAGAREAAYLAALHTGESGQFAADLLDHWQREAKPSLLDIQLARRIAFGTIQMALALDHLALQLTDRKHLKLKSKEQVLLRTAIYQLQFMERVPAYAIGNETMRLAKKYCHHHFATFLNALLRKYETAAPSLPSGTSEKALSIRHSYPQYFVRRAKKETPNLEELLHTGNEPPTLMARVRNHQVPDGWQTVFQDLLTVAIPSNESQLIEIVSSSNYYIQNATQASLIVYLNSLINPPKTIIDLCAAPGGKLIAVHDLYPQAKLFANDISKKRLRRVEENLEKYGITAELSTGQAETFQSAHSFDLVIVDAPCSNSGVLNKRPEARWRLTPEQITALNQEQLALLKAASELVSPKGFIWYITCSILRQENQELIAQAIDQLGLKPVAPPKLILPHEGWDGGFGCALKM